jgi:hypothetical protein
MAKSLFEGRIRLEALAVAPADPDALTVAELSAGQRISKSILRSGYRLSPTGSDTLNEPGLEDSGNSTTYGASNYEATFSVFRYLDESGLSDEEQDLGYNLVERIGPPASKPWEAGDPYSMYPIITDDPQQPTELSGYIKFVQPMGVTGGVVPRGTVVAGE